MPSVSWLEIRKWNGSQPDAFEELCCQFAHSEQPPDDSRFISKGRPDSGIECYWILPNEEEWGWQAKFFPDGFDKSRWQQCDDSVCKALDGHTKLTKLFFCIPYKFPDSRKPNQLSAAKHWENHRAKWIQWAKGRGRSVEFILWDEHELLLRLSKPEHSGRCWFWFNAPAMDADWFRRNIAGAVSLADERYSPDLHFELPLARHFDALGRTPGFLTTIDEFGGKLNKVLADLGGYASSKDDLGKAIEEIRQSLRVSLETVNSLSLDAKAPIDFARLEKALRSAQKLVQSALHRIWQQWQERAKQFEKEHGRRPDAYEIHNDGFSDYRLRETFSCISEVLDFCASRDAALANLPALLLVGEAGLGKTHLVCSVAEKRVAAGQPTIVLLGQQFDESEPWSQIIRFVGLSCNRDTFLGALDASGEATACRALIMIDAINDGPGVRFWQNHLAAILSHLRSYPHVGIVITIRTAYFDKAALPIQQLVSIIHHGFAGLTNEATRHFFQHYGLAEPNVPMLDPEFDSPLFLKLICRALKDSNRLELPSDLIGVSAIFKFVLDETNTRLAKKLDYAPSDQLVRKAVDRIAAMMAECSREFLPLEVTKRELDLIYPANGYSRSLLRHLIAEHVLVQSPSMAGTDEELVRFTYQRLSDHLIVQGVLARTPKYDLRKLFQRQGVFGRRMGDGSWFYGIAGWLEALAVQLPETHKLEIDQVLSGSWENDVLRRAFLCSLIWRKPTTFSAATKKRINQLLHGSHRTELLDSIICVTARPDHPYNADWLDAVLRPLEMANRDAWWSIYIFGKIEEEGNIHRLIEWACAERKENSFPDEVVRLAALALAWCLTTSDRFVRDRATKALVGLLEQRISILRWLLKHFADVAEPYVQERLHAVAYGCAMLTRQTKELQKLAQDVYDRIFRDGFPPASVLLRDHARGVVERAVRSELQINYDPTLIVPPYKSTWPKAPPSLAVLEKRFKLGTYEDKFRGLWLICNSVTSDDFSRYVIGDVSWWSDRRRKGKASQSPKALFKELLKTVRPDTAKTLEHYAECLRCIYDPNPYRGDTPENARASQRYVDYIDANLHRLLSKPQARQFQKDIVPHLKDPEDRKQQRVFSQKLFERLILRRVLELGWTCERFNEFDRNVRQKGREAHKAERIGKKYQWIAYDEFHARISDNFGLAESGTPIMRNDELERGTWPDNFRDIDPSLLLQKSPHDGWGVNQRNWWTPHNYNAWTSAPTSLDWLQQIEDLPPPTDFLELSGTDKKKWMVLDAYTCWRRKESVGDFRGRELERQEIHYIFRSYLVRREHLSAVMTWAQKQDWINDRLPSACSYYRPHLHEYYWSPYFDWPLDEAWIAEVWPINDLPHPVIQTTCDFSCSDRGYDCSVDKDFSISMPSRWLANKMGLRISGRRGDFVGSKGQIITFDPSTREPGHSTLVIQQEALREFLEREKLVLIWTLLGEKNIYPPGMNTQSWLGRLTILGIYSWDGKSINGNFRKDFFKGRG